MFGKKTPEYLAFQRTILVLMAVVGVARLVLSLAGIPDKVVVWFSMNLVGWAGAFYYGIAGARAGFTYKQLLPLALYQTVLFHGIAVLGILLAIAGLPNIYAAPEYGGGAATNPWLHVAAHLTLGMVAATLLLWGVSCLVMLVSRRAGRRPAVAASA